MRILLLILAAGMVTMTAGAQNFYNGYEYVDIGVGVLWATANIGASEPTQYGSRFAFAETEPRTQFGLSNYKYASKNEQGDYEFTLPEWGYGGFSGDPEYDAATANWGEKWRMPNELETVQLLLDCVNRDTTLNGVHCWIITGPNGNSITIPDRKYDDLNWAGQYFWTCETYPVGGEAYALRDYWGVPGAASAGMADGLAVRPVLSLDYQPVPAHGAIDLVTSDSQLSSNAGHVWSYLTGLLDTLPTYGWTCVRDMVTPPGQPYLQADLPEPFSGDLEFVMQRVMPDRDGQPTRFDVYGADTLDGEFSFLTSLDMPLRWPGTWETADISITTPVRSLRFVCTECNDTIADPEYWKLGEFRLYTNTPTSVRPARVTEQVTARYSISGQRVEGDATGIVIENGRKRLITKP